MDEHPEIDTLLKENMTAETKSHVENCDICLAIIEDSKILSLSLAGLNKEFALRPMKIERPRTSAVQCIFKF